jgi:hypothetical protein
MVLFRFLVALRAEMFATAAVVGFVCAVEESMPWSAVSQSVSIVPG